LPSHWSHASVIREFRGARFEVDMRRERGVSTVQVSLDGQSLPEPHITDIQAGRVYQVVVRIPG
jgi:cellobionic acid phosphorylase